MINYRILHRPRSLLEADPSQEDQQDQKTRVSLQSTDAVNSLDYNNKGLSVETSLTAHHSNRIAAYVFTEAKRLESSH